jgi:alkylhydroperoxidase/carboxymuconolactone decarboxylase family protein YurZ
MVKSLNPAIGELHRSVPGPMQAFHEMGRAALEHGALDTKTKELMAPAISGAVRPLHYLPRAIRAKAGRDARGNCRNGWLGRLYGRGTIGDVCRPGA